VQAQKDGNSSKKTPEYRNANLLDDVRCCEHAESTAKHDERRCHDVPPVAWKMMVQQSGEESLWLKT
jgi:hypothetical protein